MSKTNLRELARQYADGILDRDEYRSARADLLESILGDDPTDPSATDPNTDFSHHRAVAQRTEATMEPLSPMANLWVWIVGAAVVLVVVLAWLLIR